MTTHSSDTSSTEPDTRAKAKPPSPPAPAANGEQTPESKSAPLEGRPPPDKSQAAPSQTAPAAPAAPKTILVIDIGGTKMKLLATGQTDPLKFPTGRSFTPAHLVETIQKHTRNWDYEAISIGYPGLVGNQGPRSEPGNLGPGWVGFDFAAAFGKPVKMINDAAMQALGSYEGGRMLFLGLGTGLGSTLITGRMIIPLELGHLLYDRKRTLGQVLGRRGQRQLGKPKWRKAVNIVATSLIHAFVADYMVIGGGNAKNIRKLPPVARLGHNLTAFRGGFRLWSVEDVWVLAAPGEDIPTPRPQEALRMP